MSAFPHPFHIGITGTQRGMLSGQRDAIQEILTGYLSNPDQAKVVIHHG